MAAQRGRAQNDAADAARLIEVLALRPDSVVADVGAGRGELAILVAKHVVEGRVFATEIDRDRLRQIRQAVEEAGLRNVTVVEGAASETGLPDACCDAIFLRDVYHHIQDTAAMNVSFRQTLKAGGRLAILDFPPRSRGGGHGVTVETVIRELTMAGFLNVRQLPLDSERSFLVVGERPAH
jgi:ubiquinone/menaquinone biosynthesis C-methylase UbiE